MKIKIDYEIYDRIGGNFNSITISGKTLRSCLLSAFDKLQLYSDANDIIEEETEEGKKYSDDELLDILIEQSGDGSDYIFTIKDLDTGKILYTDGGPDEDTDEFESEYDDEEYYDEEDDIVESKLEEERSDDIYDFITELYNLRKESIANEGEYGLGNLVFKEFRNLGYLDNLRKLRKEAKSKELSLGEDLSRHKVMSKEEFEQFKKDHPEYTFDKKEFGTIVLKDGKQIGTYLDKFEDIWMEE